MAKLINGLKYVPLLPNTYKGISRTYFNKWNGWKLLDEYNYIPEQEVQQFYNIYFWAKLRGDEIKCQYIANLLFVFSIIAGKKKAVSKLQRVLGIEQTGVVDGHTIRVTNKYDSDYIFLALYAEIVEFAVSLNQSNLLPDILKVYYNWTGRQA